MKELLIVLLYMILIIIIGGFNMYSKLTDIQAMILFIGMFISPLVVKLLFYQRKKN